MLRVELFLHCCVKSVACSLLVVPVVRCVSRVVRSVSCVARCSMRVTCCLLAVV